MSTCVSVYLSGWDGEENITTIYCYAVSASSIQDVSLPCLSEVGFSYKTCSGQ